MLMPSDKTHLVYPLLSKYAFVLQETGYMHLQATKPDTVGKTFWPQFQIEEIPKNGFRNG